mgnify:CR=1 FL=1
MRSKDIFLEMLIPITPVTRTINGPGTVVYTHDPQGPAVFLTLYVARYTDLDSNETKENDAGGSNLVVPVSFCIDVGLPEARSFRLHVDYNESCAECLIQNIPVQYGASVSLSTSRPHKYVVYGEVQ